MLGEHQDAPRTVEGQMLLPHELVFAERYSDPQTSAVMSDLSEREADKTTATVMTEEHVSEGSSVFTPLLQRQQNFQVTPSLFPPGQQPQLHLQPWVLGYFMLDTAAVLRAILPMPTSGLLPPPPPAWKQIPPPPPASQLRGPPPFF